MKEISTSTPIIIVSGMSKPKRVLGKNNALIWHVPADLRRFKELTWGHPVIMGQKTFDSIIDILGKPFPGRTNIVVTHDKNYSHEGAKITHSLEEAVAVAESENPSEIHIGGGGEIYRQMLPYVSKLYVTWFFDDAEGDTYFPEFESEFTIETEHPIQEHDGLQFQWVDYVRKRS